MLKSPIEFSREIEERAVAEKRRIYEVLSEYLEENDIDYDSIMKLLSRSIIEKMEQEYREDGFLRGVPRGMVSLETIFDDDGT